MNGMRARGAAACVALALAIVALWATGCDNPVAALTGITGTSLGSGHSHQVTVPRADIDNPPSGGRSYTSTTAGSPLHSHTVLLRTPQLTTLQQNGASVDVASDPALTGTAAEHVHTFRFER